MQAPSSHFLSLHAVNYAYRTRPVLLSVDWQWRPGEQWACLGPNGAGKTTLAKLLCQQLAPSSGAINKSKQLLDGHTAYVCFEQQRELCDRDRRLDDSEFRSDASDPGTTVRQAICGEHPDHPQLQQWTDRLNLGPILERGIRFVSTGEMRKTLLLRAILGGPKLLILDSPLDGLDKASQAEMSDIIEQLLASEMAVLLLCRRSEDLPAGISHVLALERGEVLRRGPRAEVVSDPEVLRVMNPPLPTLGELPAPAPRPYQLEPGAALVEMHNVDVSYGATEVLRKLSWTLLPGQHCSISGPNGCGKTTLLSLINGDNHKAYGQDIQLFGIRRGSGESVWDIKQKFGLLNTQLHLNHVRSMRVLEVVISGFFDSVGLYDNWGDQQRQIASQWLQALGMGEIEREPFDTLSFGMQRMVLLARAMVKSPVILILDEPCLGLDGYHSATILRAVDHIAAYSDTQVLYVSHSSGEMPGCINQWLEFVATNDGFELTSRQR